MSMQLQKILVPIDFSEYSEQALAYAKELGTRFGAEVHLLHVLEVYASGVPAFGMGVALPERKEEPEPEALEALTKLTPEDWPSDVPTHYAVEHGPPLVGILRYARENDVDMIVLGTHGRSGLSHVFLGSVAENVVRQAHCPVLTVRRDGHQFVAC